MGPTPWHATPRAAWEALKKENRTSGAHDSDSVKRAGGND
jgi:hypothetical protein